MGTDNCVYGNIPRANCLCFGGLGHAGKEIELGQISEKNVNRGTGNERDAGVGVVVSPFHPKLDLLRGDEVKPDRTFVFGFDNGPFLRRQIG